MTPREQKGIGGWLLVIAIALALFAGRTAYYLIAFASAVHATAEVSWTFGAMYEFVGNVLLLIAALSLLVLLLWRHRLFPRLATAFLIAVIVFAVVDLALALRYPDLAAQIRLPWRTTILLAGACAVGVGYLRRSERVHATFSR